MSRSVSILGIPTDEQSSFSRGCAKGPQAIREAFLCESTNTWCEAGFDLKNHPCIRDEGDLQLTTGPGGRKTIQQTVRSLSGQGRGVLSLGGDHAITWPILKGLADRGSPVNVLHLDAHPDLYDQLDDNRYSHATPMVRALEDKLIKRLVQVGIRTMNGPQQSQADRFGVEVVTMNDWSPARQFRFDGPVYLTVDLDVLDPAFAPGVSHHEPGGFSTRELVGIIGQLDVELIGADIVELNPRRDFQSVTAMVAAKLMKEILAKMLD